MSEMIEPVPEGFLARLLRAFGIQWTHLVIISGVVFSSFHLESYLNPGVWILGTVLAFSLVYLFRHYVSGNFLKVGLWSGAAVLITVGLPFAGLLLRGYDVGDLLKSWTEAATAYLSFAVGIPIGFAILSYRAQEEFRWTPLPPGIAKATKEFIERSDFVHEKVEYEIRLARKGTDVIMRFDVTMYLVNRLKRRASYHDVFDPAGRNKRFIAASINGTQVDPDDPDRLSLRGLQLSYSAKAHERFQVAVSGESAFYERDSELVGTYLPCASLSILLRKPPGDLKVNIQSLLSRKVDPKPLHTGDILFECSDGVLPFQGARIFWERQGP